MAGARFLRLGGLLTGLLAATVLTAGSKPGAAPAIAVPALAVFLAAGLIAADRTVPRPEAAAVRTARLVRRRVVDVVPVAPAAGVAVLLVGLTGLLAVTGVASTPHKFSDVTPANPNDGRHLGCLSGGVAQSGPWPGWYYAIPIVVTVAAAVVAAAVALRGVMTRPVVDTGVPGDTYRRRTASAIVGALGVVVATPLAGAAYFAYSVLGQPFLCDEPVTPQVRPWLLALCAIATGALVYYAVRTVAPAGPAADRRRLTVDAR
jgi:hypothetical protein